MSSISDDNDGWDACQVLSYLYVGSVSAANDQQALKELGISHVLTVGRRLGLSWNDASRANNGINFHVHTILVDDHPAQSLLPCFQEAHNFIQSASSEGKVLVHCASGISRSVAACCAHLMLLDRTRISYTDALQQVRTNRPLAKPNFGFERQLQCLESCECDLGKALQKWKELEEKHTSTDAARQGREQANAFHANVDQFEETIMSASTNDLAALQNKLVMELSMLQNRIDNVLTDQVRETVGDRPTKIILQSASTKANRLLGKLYSLDDDK